EPLDDAGESAAVVEAREERFDVSMVLLEQLNGVHANLLLFRLPAPRGRAIPFSPPNPLRADSGLVAHAAHARVGVACVGARVGLGTVDPRVRGEVNDGGGSDGRCARVYCGSAARPLALEKLAPGFGPSRLTRTAGPGIFGRRGTACRLLHE